MKSLVWQPSIKHSCSMVSLLKSQMLLLCIALWACGWNARASGWNTQHKDGIYWWPHCTKKCSQWGYKKWQVSFMQQVNATKGKHRSLPSDKLKKIALLWTLLMLLLWINAKKLDALNPTRAFMILLSFHQSYTLNTSNPMISQNNHQAPSTVPSSWFHRSFILIDFFP